MKTKRVLSLLLALIILVISLASCTSEGGVTTTSPGGTEQVEKQDYVSGLKLNMKSETKKQVVTVKTYVDGDTTHFNVPEDVVRGGVLKARYLAIDTPESTGKIEPYGKKASEFTREKLSSAVSIIVESDNENWNLDSTGSRYLVWIWYKESDDGEYRNLNLEILQNGLAIASSTGNNRYGSICLSALAQARAEKLNVHSGEKDPDFYYGDAVELTLRELRLNVSDYSNIKVAFEGVITRNDGRSIYIEDHDSDTDMYFGMTVYYGFGLSGAGLSIISVGNRARIVGTVQYYEAGDSYQVSGLTYRQMKPDDPSNIKKISDGHKPAFMPVSAEKFARGTVTLEEDGKEYRFASLALYTTVSMENLTVKSIYTTVSEESSSKGAMTLTCESDGTAVVVRTAVLTDSEGNLVTADRFEGKNISVRGVVDYYDGEYQIKVLSAGDITINN